MFFLLFFIVVVAAFGIMSTLITVTVQKRREIGIVKALGANISQIIWVFLGQGTVVGLFGTLTGLGLGMTSDSLPQRIQSLARQHFAHRDFSARGLPILRNSGASRSSRRHRHLHQRIFDLLDRCADSGLFRRPPRSGESVALRIIICGDAAEFHPAQAKHPSPETRNHSLPPIRSGAGPAIFRISMPLIAHEGGHQWHCVFGRIFRCIDQSMWLALLDAATNRVCGPAAQLVKINHDRSIRIMNVAGCSLIRTAFLQFGHWIAIRNFSFFIEAAFRTPAAAFDPML